MSRTNLKNCNITIRNLKELRISLIKLILFLLFQCSIIVDLINGFTQVQLRFSTPIGVLFRVLIITLVIISSYQYFTTRQSRFLRLYVSFFIIIIPIWFIEVACFTGFGFSISVELDHLIRYIYNILILTFFLVNRNILSKYNLPSIIGTYGAIISFALIFSFITGMGNPSMNADYGFGTKSYFKAGNDLGLTVLYAAIVSSIDLVQNFNYTKLFKTIFILVGCSLIGSRIAMIGALFWLIVILSYFCLLYRTQGSDRRNKIILFRLLLIPTITYALYSLIAFIVLSFDNFMLMKFSLEGFQNARTILTDQAINYINRLNWIEFIFGKGLSPLYNYVGANLVGSNEYKVVEADFHELLGGYGLLGLVILSVPYLYFGLKSIKLYISQSNFNNFCIVFICTSFLAFAFLGGHCFKNSMVAPIYGYIASLIYHNEGFDN